MQEIYHWVTKFGMRYLLNRSYSKSCSFPLSPNRILYLPASSLPFHISGYTTRTHAVIRSLVAAGGDVHILTRIGYPWDRNDRLQSPQASETLVDGLLYGHAQYPSNRRMLLQYVFQASKVIENVARNKRVSVIHAASNHTNALPALLAARRLRIPFQYEMRGLWELTRASRMPAFENSPGFRQGLEWEGFVASHADKLFVISDQLGRYAHERWGVPLDRMALLPNCIDPSEIFPDLKSNVEPNRLGYAGSLISYEGLDTLIEAVGALTKAGSNIKLNIVGDGEARPALENLVSQHGLVGQVSFFGKVAPETARAILCRCVLVCIPRKPFKVCEIVPPIKLIESMALGRPVIVPDLPVFRDEMGTDPAGWFFKSGDVTDLAGVIQDALSNPDRLAEFGERARTYAVTHRRWCDFVTKVLPTEQSGE